MTTKVTRKQKVISRQQLLKLLEEDMLFCGLVEITKQQYRLVIKRYLDFTENNPDFSRQEIMEFNTSLGKVTSTYAAWVISIVKRFHRTIRDILPDNKRNWPLGPREGPKVERRQQPSFDIVIIDKFLSIIFNTRDYAMARLLFATGMRREEVCRLDEDDYSGSSITIKMAKGEELRTVKLDNKTSIAINDYIKSRSDRSSALFVNDHSKRFTPSGLSQVFNKYFRRLQLEKGTGFHAFRRGLVKVLHDRGLSVIEIQKFMGWKTSKMVEVYIQLSPSEISERVEAVHPFYQEDKKNV